MQKIICIYIDKLIWPLDKFINRHISGTFIQICTQTCIRTHTIIIIFIKNFISIYDSGSAELHISECLWAGGFPLAIC